MNDLDSIDWLNDFYNKFIQYPEIKELKRNRFHGSIEINFCAGIPQNYNLKMHRRAEVGISDDVNNFKAERP